MLFCFASNFISALRNVGLQSWRSADVAVRLQELLTAERLGTAESPGTSPRALGFLYSGLDGIARHKQLAFNERDVSVNHSEEVQLTAVCKGIVLRRVCEHFRLGRVFERCHKDQ